MDDQLPDQDEPWTGRRRWLILIGLLVAVIAFGFAVALRSGGHRTVVKAGPAFVTGADDATLTFVVPTCHGAPAVTVTESPTEVRVRIVSDTSSSDKCADEVQAHLQTALGTRTVIDDKTGSPIAVRHGSQ